jgi:hypothetical protein
VTAYIFIYVVAVIFCIDNARVIYTKITANSQARF